MAECLFCGIVQGTIPASKVRENDRFVAFRDINPQAPTHVLVIPRAHCPTLNQASDAAMLGELVLFARDVALDEGISEDGYRVVINTNAGAGQSVFHIHAHVLGGRRMGWPPG
jgi:histidine triad (HIT) family protein